MNAAIEIVALGEDDWQRYRSVRLRALTTDPDAFYRVVADEQAFDEADWRARLQDRHATLVVAAAGDADVGLVGVVAHGDQPDEGLLVSLWVDPQARGAGVGEWLVQHAIGAARDEGYQALRLEVGDFNRSARDLYLRMGFVPTGVRSSFPPPRDHITEEELRLSLLDAGRAPSGRGAGV